MFSLQKFFGKDPIFFDLFDKSADQVLMAAQSLKKVLTNPKDPNCLQHIKEARRNSKEITEKIQELVIKTFVTSLEREDIESLATSLYRVIKPMEKFAERYRIATPIVNESDFVSQIGILIHAAELIKEMVKLVKRSGKLDEGRKLNSALKQAESDADSLEIELLRQLYNTESIDPKRLFVAKDMYSILEKGVDRARDVGTVVMHIILKNS